MLRAGYVRQLGSGLYSWIPIGLRTLTKIAAIVREEMNRAGALELLMPAVQPAELWQESGRWDQMGAEMLRFKDRHMNDFCLGPPHDEVICHPFRPRSEDHTSELLSLIRFSFSFFFFLYYFFFF